MDSYQKIFQAIYTYRTVMDGYKRNLITNFQKNFTALF